MISNDFGKLETHLRDQRSSGKKLLVPYITAGMTPEWLELVSAIAQAGADAIEIGLPFSDPVMDGPIIQKSSSIALERGTTTGETLDSLAKLKLDIPLVVMTYYNLIFRKGDHFFSSALSKSGVSAVIIPDLPFDEIGPWAQAASENNIETILLTAPSTNEQRLRDICLSSKGFIYAVGLLGVTGLRQSLSETALILSKRIKSLTDKPVLVGVGISNLDQAKKACEQADGVIVGSSLVQKIINGAGVKEASEFIYEMRKGLDAT